MLTRSRSRSEDSSSSSSPLPPDPSSLGDSASLEEIEPPAHPSKKPKKKSGRGFPKRKTDEWVGVLPSSSNQDSGHQSLSIVSLKHPSSGISCKYLLKDGGGKGRSQLCEILKFSDDPRSWFVGNSIHTDGSLLICTPVDPLFMALPYFTAAAKSGTFTTLDVILEDVDHDTFAILTKCVPPEQWLNISQMKDVGGVISVVYRFSRERTLSWLRRKVTALADTLAQEKVYVGKGSQSSMLVKSHKESRGTKEEYLEFACGMVKDYLSKDLAKELSQIYSVSSTSVESPKCSAEVNGGSGSELEPPAAKRSRTTAGNSEPLEDYSKVTTITPQLVKMASATTKQTAAQKSLAKIDKTGMKSLSSFFKKKPKN